MRPASVPQAQLARSSGSRVTDGWTGRCPWRPAADRHPLWEASFKAAVRGRMSLPFATVNGATAKARRE